MYPWCSLFCCWLLLRTQAGSERVFNSGSSLKQDPGDEFFIVPLCSVATSDDNSNNDNNNNNNSSYDNKDRV